MIPKWFSLKGHCWKDQTGFNWTNAE